MLFLISWLPLKGDQVMAQAVVSCGIGNKSLEIYNTAIADYNETENSQVQSSITSNILKTNSISKSEQKIQVINQGIEGADGKIVSALGAIADDLIQGFKQQGLNEESAKVASLAAISQWTALPADSPSVKVVKAIKQSVTEALGQEQKQVIEQIPDEELLTSLGGLQASTLQGLGLTTQEIEAASQSKIRPQATGSLAEQIRNTVQASVASISRPEAKVKITDFQAKSELEQNNIRQGRQAILPSKSQLRFKFRLHNKSEQGVRVKLPNVQSITDNGLTGVGKVTRVAYNLATADPKIQKIDTNVSQDVEIPAGQSLDLEIQVEVGEVSKDTISTISIDLQTNCGDRNTVQTLNILPPIIEDDNVLIDPRGKISGCAGELLADYQGFSVGLYDLDANDPTASEAGEITSLTATELPDDPNNNVPLGIEPNIENSNPFFLTNSDAGKYSFLFDEEAGQLDKGRNYILVVDPGEDSIYDQRRIKITIGDRQERVVKYTATSLDGRPISAIDDQTTITGEIVLVRDAERVGLNLAVLDLSTNICDAEEISITKTGDRSSAEPGDIVIYRLALRNLASVPLTNFQVSDTLPQGFHLEADSVRAEVAGALVTLETTQNNRLVNFTATNITVLPGEVLNLIYAAQVTPDALRGSGENSAIVNAQRTDNKIGVKDGPAIHSLRLEPGIIQDSGTLIGRVFVDKNFDGEQQSGEPGVPNAVIYLEDGNRIITDAEGLFSVTNLLPGYHTGILDFTSTPEYRLAPNLRFSQANSKSRLVNLEPGGIVRMNFGVTPTAEGIDSGSRRKAPTSPPAQPKKNPQFDQ